MPVRDYLDCGCPRGAGEYTGNLYVVEDPTVSADGTTYLTTNAGDVMPTFQLQAETPDQLLSRAESTFPIGSQAKLFAPTPVDRGPWVAARLVDTFVKTPNGRWTSYPGNDVNYPTLAALAMATPIQEVFTPGQGEIVNDDGMVDQEGENFGAIADDPDPVADAVADVEEMAEPIQYSMATTPRAPLSKKAKITIAALGVAALGGIGLLFYLGGKKRR